jgi:hypothetical protein
MKSRMKVHCAAMVVSHAHDRSLFQNIETPIIIVRYHKWNNYGQVARAQATLVNYHNFLNWRYGYHENGHIPLFIITTSQVYKAMVIYHECAKPWLCSPSASNVGKLSQLLKLAIWISREWSYTAVHYHKCTKLWSYITSVRSHGCVARDHIIPADYCKLLYW